MATYQTLRDRALNRVGCLGQSEAQTVAQNAMEEAMRFISFHVRVPSLISSATATAPASPTLKANAITLGVSGFNITATFQCIDRLYVKKDSSGDDEGVPYVYREYHHFLDIKNDPSPYRYSIDSPEIFDENPQRVFTITPDNKLWAMPLTQNNVLTLYYRVLPAAYSGGATPEVLPLFDYILVNAAEIALKEYLREPAEITNLWRLFEGGIMDDVKKYDEYLNGQYKRDSLKIHRSYRTC